jgi:hypothetical protein
VAVPSLADTAAFAANSALVELEGTSAAYWARDVVYDLLRLYREWRA